MSFVSRVLAAATKLTRLLAIFLRKAAQLMAAAFRLVFRKRSSDGARSEGSMRGRILRAFVAFSAGLGLVFGLLGYAAYEVTVDYLVRGHLEPVMDQIVDASEGKIRSRDGGAIPPEVLADSLGVRLVREADLRKDQIPRKRGKDKLIRLSRERYLLVYVSKGGKIYALRNKIDDFSDLEQVVAWVFLGCFAGCFVLALLLGAGLGRNLANPLLELAGRVGSGEPLEKSALCRRRDEVGFLARSFAAREQELRDFLAREQLFTGDVSHELRTPLTVLQGGLEILESRLPQDGPERPVIERLQRALTGMAVTVNTMLLLARAPEQLEIVDLDMTALVRREAEETRRRLEGTDVAFAAKIADGVHSAGNVNLGGMILRNLLDNACRYTESGHIELRLEPGGFSVTDTATPIPAELRKRMFRRGWRGTARVPGSGLGLSLAQRACERLGWSVNHEPAGNGNRFTVCFGVTRSG